MAEAKDNFKGALYEMFGVGDGGSSNQSSSKASVEKKAAVPSQTAGEKKSEPVTPVQPVAEPVRKAKTYLAPGTVIKGELSSDGDIEIAGEFEGNIFSQGAVTLRRSINGNVDAVELHLDKCELVGDVKVSGVADVSAGSCVRGNISSSTAVIGGEVYGDIAAETVDIQAAAVINGNITAKIMGCAQSAQISGHLTIGGKK